MEDLIGDFLEEAQIRYDKKYDDEGDPIFATELELNGADFWVCILVAREYQTVSIYIKSPIKIPEYKRVEIAEYIARANYHNYEGSLKLDFDDGSLFYQYVLRYDPGADIQHIRYQLNVSLGMGIDEMEQHFPAISTIVYGNSSPEKAINEVQFGTNPRLN